MKEELAARITMYREMIEGFVSGRMTIESFERSYLAAFKGEKVHLPDHIFQLLDDLFFDVDAYCGDEAIRTADHIDGVQLRNRAATTLQELKNEPTSQP